MAVSPRGRPIRGNLEVMSSVRDSLDNLFGSTSPLSSHLEGFAHRPEQLEMAQRVVQAMHEGGYLAVEAGAGTGKTLAYLVPALLSRRRVIVATGTKTLQDQLYHRDLPVVSSAIGRPAVVAQLKGRANYLCRYRLQRAAETLAPAQRPLVRDLRLVEQWAARTVAGDVSELSDVAEGAEIWPLVTSTADNCLGGRCTEIERCHVAAARKRAVDADIAIVNHHLLLADMTLQDDGFGRLLPGAEVVIVDEAHRFPDTAQALFDVTLSSRQVDTLLRDAATEARQAGAVSLELQQRLERVAAALAAVAGCLGGSAGSGNMGQVRGAVGTGQPLAMANAPAPLTGLLETAAEALESLADALGERAELSPGLARCSERAAAAATAAARIAEWESLSELCWIQAQPNENGAFVAHLTPLDGSRQLRELIEAQAPTWIFTSATLAIGDDFTHFSSRLGLESLDTCRFDSPFDYPSCARLYLPRDLPPPDAPNYTDRVIEAIEPVLATSGGRAFLLFTSRRAMFRAAELLTERNHGHALLVQGSAPRSRLIEQFARTPNAVLLGTATFWEGVDIRGPALVVVVIDRLPFASPGDPFMQARLELVKRQGGDPFRDYQLPQAVLALRQGVGRLIRGHSDYGIVMICDPRLTQRGYGRKFLASLPPMPIVHTAAEACAFLAEQELQQQQEQTG